VITKSFVSDTPFSHRGKYWQYDNIVVEPPSAQRPHPPFWMGAGSERSVRQVAERGYNMLLGQHDLAEDVIRHIAQFKSDVAARGRRYDPMHVGVARAVHFADTAEELEAAQVRRFQGHLRINKLAERPGDEQGFRFRSGVELRLKSLHLAQQAVIGLLKSLSDEIRPASPVCEQFMPGRRRAFDPRHIIRPAAAGTKDAKDDSHPAARMPG
jgi:alkanesulfonate monooxygenase SsuD/methylene tetrahydromethanopterin reductase-like flavin-dependent oxidoreductase (luciferase family)